MISEDRPDSMGATGGGLRFLFMFMAPAMFWCVLVLIVAVTFFDPPSLSNPGPLDWKLFWQPVTIYAFGPVLMTAISTLIGWALVNLVFTPKR